MRKMLKKSEEMWGKKSEKIEKIMAEERRRKKYF